MSSSTIYIHPTGFAALEAAFQDANIRPVIVQTEGNASASAGTHDSDGTYQLANGHWQSYSGAIDLSVNQKATKISDNSKITMTEARIKWLLYNLARHGIVGWYRVPSQGFEYHMHIITPMVKIKTSLDNQVVDFLNNRTGLASHGTEKFWTASPDLDDRIAKAFLSANPEARSRVPARFRG